ncbi:uncharacterized protein LOC110696930 isoform X2 [Chenopodium quinoa]|uniref:uncharacterized protein LOC110696930 isoform X2 n=1 Tax=Chenopodium quinoa TaxID=63459 RepID=UPI000B7800A4|nr:uncharacterized protein LOC110696930 isoform X2 [Chenopodium quinoa]
MMLQQYPNIVCRVESFCKVVKVFDLRRRALVTEMGFEGLLDLDMKNIPSQFCYWLMTRVVPDGTMVFGNSEILPLGPAQVRSVLGLPMDAEKVHLDIGENDEEQVQKMRRNFNLYGVGANKETISLKFASDALCPLDESGEPIPLADEVEEEDFMTTFLLVALGKVVCATTNNSNFPKTLIPALTVATEAIKYDWCSLTFEWLCDTANRFQRKFQKDGYRSGCGGSLLFAMIYYLDHLHRVPLKWGVYPRVKVWNSAKVKAVGVNKKAPLLEDRDQASVDDVIVLPWKFPSFKILFVLYIEPFLRNNQNITATVITTKANFSKSHSGSLRIKTNF